MRTDPVPLVSTVPGNGNIFSSETHSKISDPENSCFTFDNSLSSSNEDFPTDLSCPFGQKAPNLETTVAPAEGALSPCCGLGPQRT